MEDDIDLRGALRLLRRHARLILIATILGATAAILASAFQPPLYSATALVLVDPHTNLLDPDNADGLGGVARVGSEVEILLSDSILLKVVDRLQLDTDAAYIAPSPIAQLLYPDTEGTSRDVDRVRALQTLRDRIRADRRGLTDVIAIEALSDQPGAAAALANTAVAVYVDRQIEAKIANVASAQRLLSERIATTRAADNATASAHVDLLERRARELETLASLQTANSRLVSAAIAPILPAYPNRLAWLVIGCTLGLGIGCVIAYTRETLTGGLYDEDDAERRLSAPVMGVLPNGVRRITGRCPSEAIVEEPLGSFANAVRILRANLDHARDPVAGAHVIVVSSSHPGEGKTVLSRSLARSYALAGQRTLLVDCDLRSTRPVGETRQVGLGLTAYLRAAGDMDLDHLVMRDELTGASVVPAGEPLAPADVDRVIVGSILEKLVTSARSGFDVVILDCAALDHAADALYLAPLADSILIVARSASTPYRIIRRHLARLGTATGPNRNILVAINSQTEVRSKGWHALPRIFGPSPDRAALSR